ncbi:MAG: Ig-like domain-containing protein, partial [Actinobacteria bacterium]|nr:Ig-like domain-containing protein [Actinomycetota bacterium]
MTGSAATRTVTATTGSGDGTLGLNLASPASITDAAGNTMSASLTGASYTLDRSAPTGVTLTMPSGTLRGSVTLSATASDTSAITVVRLQRSPAGAGTWTDACTDSSSPYACAFDTTVVADGSYDFRATATDAAQNTGTSTVAANRLIDNVGPTVALADPGADVRATIALIATAGDGAGSGVASVRIERSPADVNTWSEVCTDTSSPYVCSLDTTTLANGGYDLRAVATDLSANVTTSTIQTIGVDNAPPTITLTDPGSPLSGTVILTSTPADVDSGIATVTIQRAASGASTWTDVCVIATAPWSCAFATTSVADGLYDLRAIAVDVAGNTRTSTIVSARRVDNTISSVSLDDPGSPLRATITLTANANSSGGVGSVLIQRSPAGAATWTDVCTDTTSPYSCSLNTAAGVTPDGSY